ncbi:MAG: hypothetical protein WDW21_00820 [Neisseriaceae bacterium]
MIGYNEECILAWAEANFGIMRAGMYALSNVIIFSLLVSCSAREEKVIDCQKNFTHECERELDTYQMSVHPVLRSDFSALGCQQGNAIACSALRPLVNENSLEDIKRRRGVSFLGFTDSVGFSMQILDVHTPGETSFCDMQSRGYRACLDFVQTLKGASYWIEKALGASEQSSQNMLGQTVGAGPTLQFWQCQGEDSAGYADLSLGPITNPCERREMERIWDEPSAVTVVYQTVGSEPLVQQQNQEISPSSIHTLPQNFMVETKDEFRVSADRFIQSVCGADIFCTTEAKRLLKLEDWSGEHLSSFVKGERNETGIPNTGVRAEAFLPLNGSGNNLDSEVGSQVDLSSSGPVKLFAGLCSSCASYSINENSILDSSRLNRKNTNLLDAEFTLQQKLIGGTNEGFLPTLGIGRGGALIKQVTELGNRQNSASSDPLQRTWVENLVSYPAAKLIGRESGLQTVGDAWIIPPRDSQQGNTATPSALFLHSVAEGKISQQVRQLERRNLLTKSIQAGEQKEGIQKYKHQLWQAAAETGAKSQQQELKLNREIQFQEALQKGRTVALLEIQKQKQLKLGEQQGRQSESSLMNISRQKGLLNALQAGAEQEKISLDKRRNYHEAVQVAKGEEIAVLGRERQQQFQLGMSQGIIAAEQQKEKLRDYQEGLEHGAFLAKQESLSSSVKPTGTSPLKRNDLNKFGK